MKSIPIFLILIMLGTACYYDSEEDLYPRLQQACDTSQVTFSGSIVPMLDNHCWACHSNASAPAFGNNIALEDYADVAAATEAVMGAIRHESPWSPMPKNSAKLDACLISQFEIWVRDGAIEN